MSDKRSLIIIGVVLAILVVFVYHFSTPEGSVHMAPMITPDDHVQPQHPPVATDSTRIDTAR